MNRKKELKRFIGILKSYCTRQMTTHDLLTKYVGKKMFDDLEHGVTHRIWWGNLLIINRGGHVELYGNGSTEVFSLQTLQDFLDLVEAEEFKKRVAKI